MKRSIRRTHGLLWPILGVVLIAIVATALTIRQDRGLDAPAIQLSPPQVAE